MQKPLVVLRQDFITEVVALINKYGQSGLPMFAILDILGDVQKEVQTAAQNQYKTALEQYEKESSAEAEKVEAEVVEN